MAVLSYVLSWERELCQWFSSSNMYIKNEGKSSGIANSEGIHQTQNGKQYVNWLLTFTHHMRNKCLAYANFRLHTFASIFHVIHRKKDQTIDCILCAFNNGHCPYSQPKRSDTRACHQDSPLSQLCKLQQLCSYPILLVYPRSCP